MALSRPSSSLRTSSMLGALLLLGVSGGCAVDDAAVDDAAVDERSTTSDESSAEHTSGERESTSSSSPEADGGAQLPVARCSPGPGATGSPTTIIEVIELINSLPMPVTIPCLLQSLERPLKLVATASVISAQPANGQANPRLFLVGDGLSLSFVPTGEASHLLEVGELTSNTRSIKGELAFPITEPLALDAAFKHIERPSGGTVCFVCHRSEAAVESYPVAGAFDSVAYRPIAGLEINFDYVEYQYTTCDSAAEPDRCAFFAALFDQGQVSRGEFPPDMPTFE